MKDISEKLAKEQTDVIDTFIDLAEKQSNMVSRLFNAWLPVFKMHQDIIKIYMPILNIAPETLFQSINRGWDFNLVDINDPD